MSTSPTFVASYASQTTQLVNQYGAGGGAAIWQAGANGSRIHAMACTNDDTLAPTITLYRGYVVSSNASASMTITSSTITRGFGSFLTDGWIANQRVFLMGETVSPDNQQVLPISSLTATTLTFSGTPLHADTPPTTLQLVRANLLWAVSIVAGAGNGSSIPAQNLMLPSQYPSFNPQPDTFLMLGPSEVLIAILSGAVDTLKSVDVTVEGGNY